jgi:hypothetical protein
MNVSEGEEMMGNMVDVYWTWIYFMSSEFHGVFIGGMKVELGVYIDERSIVWFRGEINGEILRQVMMAG